MEKLFEPDLYSWYNKGLVKGGNTIKSLQELEDLTVLWNKIARSEPPSEEQQQAIVEEELKELKQAIQEVDFVEELDAIADIFFTGVYLFHVYPDNVVCKEVERVLNEAIDCYGGALIVECIEEVVKSNYTKFLSTEDLVELAPEIKEEKEYILSQGKAQRVVTNTKEDYVVFLNENNKVMKPSFYTPPNIKSIIDKHAKQWGTLIDQDSN